MKNRLTQKDNYLCRTMSKSAIKSKKISNNYCKNEKLMLY